MSKSAGNFQRITGAGRGGHRPARLPLPVPDGAVFPKAQLLRQIPGGCGGGAGIAAGRAGGACSPVAEDRGATRAGDGDDAASGAPITAGAPDVPLRPDAGRALHDRFVAAIDDDLDTPAALRSRGRRSAPRCRDERRWLVLDFDLVLGLDLDRAVRARTPKAAPGRSKPGMDLARCPGVCSRPNGRSGRPRLRTRRSAPRRPAGPGHRGDRSADGASEALRTDRADACRRLRGLPISGSPVEAAEAVEDPVEVALRRRSRTRSGVAVQARGSPRSSGSPANDRPPRRARPRPRPEDQAPPDVEVAVEAERLVERPARHRRRPGGRPCR